MKSRSKVRIQIHGMFECLNRKIQFARHLIDATEIVVGHEKLRLKRDRSLQQVHSLLVLVILHTGYCFVVELSGLVNGLIAVLCRSYIRYQKQQYCNEREFPESKHWSTPVIQPVD